MPSDGHTPKSGPLIYTENYVYNVADCLGKGATASVYLARSRKDGNQVAVKVFSEHESRHITMARIRETDLLRTTNHRNIMKFLASERVKDSGLEVIVLEYCQGGSVYTLLEQPNYALGFPEKEFLIFLRDITEGLQYLNTKGIIHRDIKPGNILKKIEDDGSSVYILTDFGAARELGEEETFCSIYGTEEYIHPHMFQRGVLRQPGESRFTSSVDLWSLAVTVYHVACGHLPFIAFAGRSDSQTLFQIISGRGPGDISGIQRSQNGPIDRSKDLPETTYISRSLKNLLRPMIAGLFEADQTKALTFDQYFKMVKNILEMKTITVLYCDSCVNYKVYVNKSDCFVHLQEQLASLTDIPAERQLLLLGDKELKTVVQINEQIVSYPKSVQSAQLFLFERDCYDIHKPVIAKLPPFPSLIFNTSLSNDASVAKQSAGVAFYIEWATKETLENQRLLLEALLNLRHFVQIELKWADVLVPELETQIAMTQKRLSSLQLSQQNLSSFGNVLEMFIGNKDKDLKKALEKFCSPDQNLIEVLEKTSNRCTEIAVYLSLLKQKLKDHSAAGPTDHMGCNEDHDCLVKIGHLRQGIQTVASTFSKHKKYGELHPHEQFIHQVEREKFENLCVKIVSLYQSHCVQNLKQLHHSVQKQIGLLMKHLTRVGKVECNIKCVTDCQPQIIDKINKMDDSYAKLTEAITANVAKIVSSPSSTMKIARPEVTEFTELPSESSCVTSVKSAERALLFKQLMIEVTSLKTESSEIDNIVNSSMSSLLDLKRKLETQSRLDPTSFQQDTLSTGFKRLEPVVEHQEFTPTASAVQSGITGENQIARPPCLNEDGCLVYNTPQSLVTNINTPLMSSSMSSKLASVFMPGMSTSASAVFTSTPIVAVTDSVQANGVPGTQAFTIYDRSVDSPLMGESSLFSTTQQNSPVVWSIKQPSLAENGKTAPHLSGQVRHGLENISNMSGSQVRSPSEHVDVRNGVDGNS